MDSIGRDDLVRAAADFFGLEIKRHFQYFQTGYKHAWEFNGFVIRWRGDIGYYLVRPHSECRTAPSPYTLLAEIALTS